MHATFWSEYLKIRDALKWEDNTIVDLKGNSGHVN
jgi:hypothetical protein